MNTNIKLKVQAIVAIASLLASFFVGFASPAKAATGDLIITGVIDGPLAGGTPKAIELYVVNNIADLGIYGLGSANNGGGTDGEEFTFPADSATTGDFIYVATEATEFNNFFGFAPNYTSGAASINGDDAIELFQSGAVVDVFGDINVDGTGEPWEYLDGWAYRVDGTGQDGSTFVLGNWSFSGPNALDGETTNAGATTPFPLGTYLPGSAGDTAPSVSSTTPANSDTGVAVDADISINFSEDVTVTDAWFDITCGSSGTHTTAVSGGPQIYTLNPDADFANGETCTVTVFAAQVADTDTDDPPDNMAADYLFGFDTTLGVTDFVINEIHADPDSTNGDANGDGTAHYSQDEFVEIVNNSDNDINISGWTLADGYSVRHVFPAETVVSAHCAIVVFGGGSPSGAFGNAIVQTASTGQLGLNNSGDSVILNDGSTDQATVSYGSEGGDNQSLTRDPDITGSFVKHSDATGSGGALFSPGTMIDGSLFAGCSACGTLATFIHDIQGNGMSSPEDGNVHVIEGVVVGDFQTSAHLRGFFLQEEDADADTDTTTSEGIFVYDGSSPAVDVNVGDVVRVEGQVDEFYDLTELTNVSSVEICPPGGVASAATVILPVTSVNDWEWYEGMLINIPQTLYATGNYYQGRYGEVDLSVNDRLDTPTNVVEPGAPAIALQDLNDRSRIQLEDGRTTQNPVPVPYIGTGGTLRAGDTIPELTGVLHYAYGAYEVHPTGAVNFTRVNTREATPPPVGTTVKVASFNVLNYFTTLDDSGPICGPTGGMDCRGADNAAEFTRQRDKIIDAIVKMDADVIGLMEMENHPTDAALQDLVSGLNAVAGAGTYALINTGPIGTDVIKVAFIYKPGVVTPVASFAILDSSVDPTFNDQRNRPVLAQTFQENGGGEKFTVAVNHLKSKGSACDDIGDPDTGDGQGNCNLTRTAAATALVNWLAGDPTFSGDPDSLIIGDLNSYAQEDPIDAIKAGGYTNLLETLADPYTYVYYGQAGYLDHALTNSSLANQVSGVAIWHINTDEPAALDYNDYNQPAGLYNPDPYRASDHDSVLIGLDLSGPTAIELASFTAEAGVSSARLAWETGTEIDNAGFNLYRATAPDGPYTQINAALIAAEGDPVAGASYSFLNKGLAAGTYYYKLEDVDLNGTTTLHGPVSARVLPGLRKPSYRPTAP